MKITFSSSRDRIRPNETYGFSGHGRDFNLAVVDFGVIEFESPEDATWVGIV